jgi:hypothetical protein
MICERWKDKMRVLVGRSCQVKRDLGARGKKETLGRSVGSDKASLQAPDSERRISQGKLANWWYGRTSLEFVMMMMMVVVGRLAYPYSRFEL